MRNKIMKNILLIGLGRFWETYGRTTEPDGT